jgi:DNA invertase Pin-like site-specific DNA recombinase
MGRTGERDAGRSAARAALRRWGTNRRTLENDRDQVVLGALEAGITKEEIHIVTGLGRSTIDRIEKGQNQ